MNDSHWTVKLQLLKLIKGGKHMNEMINLIGLLFSEMFGIFSNGSLDCMSSR